MEKLFSVPLKGGISTDVYSLSLSELPAKFSDYGRSVLFVADSNSACYLPPSCESLVLPPGESEKRWESVDRILSRAAGAGMARDSVFIAVGGGVILDMTAFAASVYMRGARVVLVPTTLLSSVDATLGGKTGIDYAGAKNFVGTFYPAEDVLIASETLSTLSEREFRCGLGEVVKHAFLSQDRTLHDFLLSEREAVLRRDKAALDEMIRLSLEVKIWYITRDPEEKKGIRSALNFGHTFGHALESCSSYSVSHGEGVAWGMVRAFRAGVNLGITPSEYADECIGLIRSFGFDTESSIKDEEFPVFCEAIAKDKKKKSGSVRFVLLEGQGRPVLMPLAEDEIKKALR